MSSNQDRVSGGDGLNRQARAGEPESAYPPGILAVPVKAMPGVKWIVNPTGIPDTSISGPVILQQPSRWTHDFDPVSGESRASIPAVTPIFESAPPQAPTAPPGSSNSQLATTEFVMRESEATIIRAVATGRVGVTNGFDARPGDIGEFLSVTVPQPGLELTTSQITTLNQLELPPGDWDLQASAVFQSSGVGLPATTYVIALTDVPTAFPGFLNAGGTSSLTMVPAGLDTALNSFQRWSSSQTAIIFLLGYAAFTGSGQRVFAASFMSARRRR